MKVATVRALAAFLFGLIALAPLRGAAAAADSKTRSHTAIFVANSYSVTAYPTGSRRGDVMPIALTTDMTAPGGIARDASGRIYITNTATNTVTVYAAKSSGNVPPIAVIGGSNTRLVNPDGIALDASGKIYVLNHTEYPKGNITVYPPLGANAGILNEAPIGTIAGAKTLLDDPAGIALDAHGNLYVANQLGGPAVRHEPSDRGRVTVYSAGSNGDVAPIATISGALTGLASPVGIALDSDANIYVANSYTANSTTYLPSIAVYSAGSTGDTLPVASSLAIIPVSRTHRA
jgi:hypothetical protein